MSRMHQRIAQRKVSDDNHRVACQIDGSWVQFTPEHQQAQLRCVLHVVNQSISSIRVF